MPRSTSTKWEALTSEQRKKFPALTPDFVIELRSETERLKSLQDKMQEYLENGLRLGWLINPQDEQVDIYQLTALPVAVVQIPALLSGEEVLPGFELYSTLQVNEVQRCCLKARQRGIFTSEF